MERKNVMKVPCHGCEDRIVGCHSVCEKYKAYRKWLDGQNEVAEKERRLSNLQASYEIDRIRRINAIGRQRKFKNI